MSKHKLQRFNHTVWMKRKKLYRYKYLSDLDAQVILAIFCHKIPGPLKQFLSYVCFSLK